MLEPKLLKKFFLIQKTYYCYVKIYSLGLWDDVGTFLHA